MNRMNRVFSRGKAFIPFITAGDPSLPITEKLVVELAEAGADLIELGIPFSDPVAEGVVIQQADYRALQGGATTDQIFAMVKRVRQVCDVPLAFMTYINPVFTYGSERFMGNCREVGVDAVIVPDLPFEEKSELLPECRANGVDLISLIAPTSKDRVQMIAREAMGFVYCVSSLGVTGVRQELGGEVEQIIKLVKQVKDIPCAVGFGISTPRQAASMARISDGVIVGSAIVKIVEQYGMDCIPHVSSYVRAMKKAISEL
jgi:tryptophan synthase alpha chain